MHGPPACSQSKDHTEAVGWAFRREAGCVLFFSAGLGTLESHSTSTHRGSSAACPSRLPFPRPCCPQNGVHTPHPGLWGPPAPPPELRNPVFPRPYALVVLLSGVCQTFLPTSNITSSKLILKICPKSEHSPHFHCYDPGPTPGRLSPDLLN